MGYLIIFLTCVLVYFRSLKYGITADDITNRKKSVHPTFNGNRFLTQFRYSLNGQHPVKSVFFDHIITLSLHTIVCLYIYHAFGGFAAAMLFAVNVSNNQASLWLNGKRYAVNAVLCLLSYCYAPIGVGFWFLTPFFQASAATFPLILALKVHWSLALLIPATLIVGKGFLVRWAKVRYTQTVVKENITFRFKKIILVFKTLAYYFLHGIIPYAPTMYPDELKMFGIGKEETEKAYRFDAQALAGLMLIVLTIVGYSINQNIFFGLVWWMITIAIFSNWVTVTVPIAERYMYLPNIGLMLFFANILNMIHPFLWLAVFCVYTSRIILFMPMYKEINNFIRHHCFYYPNNDQAWIYRANQFADVNDVAGMLFLTNEGLIANKNSPILWAQRASALNVVGQKELAIFSLNKAKFYSKDLMSDLFSKAINLVETNINKKEK